MLDEKRRQRFLLRGLVLVDDRKMDEGNPAGLCDILELGVVRDDERHFQRQRADAAAIEQVHQRVTETRYQDDGTGLLGCKEEPGIHLHPGRQRCERGFKFVGPVIIYAWMQAVGIVNDHTPTCFRRNAV